MKFEQTIGEGEVRECCWRDANPRLTLPIEVEERKIHASTAAAVEVLTGARAANLPEGPSEEWLFGFQIVDHDFHRLIHGFVGHFVGGTWKDSTKP